MITWEDIQPLLYGKCHDSQVKVRLSMLQDVLKLLQGDTITNNDAALNSIADTVLTTYNFYQDTHSKNAVIEILLKLINTDTKFLSKFLAYISNLVASDTGTRAVVDYLNLLEWTLSFFKVVFKDADELFSTYGNNLIAVYGHTVANIETVLDNQESTKKDVRRQNQHRKRLRLSVLQQSIKTFVSCFASKQGSSSMFIESTVSFVLDNFSKLKIPSSGLVITIGCISNAAMQYQVKGPIQRDTLSRYAENIAEILAKEVILAKIPPSPYCIEVFLQQYLRHFMTGNDFKKHILTSLEKANIRSPETSFQLSAEIFDVVGTTNINLMESFVSSKCISQTFSAFKSTKENVRDDSLRSAMSLLRSINSATCDENSLGEFVDEVFKNLKANPNVDYKTTVGTLLATVPTFSSTISRKILDGLIFYITKESNENALRAFLSAFFLHLFVINLANDQYLDIVKKGLADKKPALKKVWSTALLSKIQYAEADLILALKSEALEVLKDTFSTPTKSGRLLTLGCFAYVQRIFDLGLAAHLSTLEEFLNSKEISFGFCWLYVTLSGCLTFEQRTASYDLLNKAFVRSPELIGFSVIDVLEKLAKGNLTNIDDIDFQLVGPLFTILSQHISSADISEKLVLRLLVMSHLSSVKVKNGWANLAINAGFDPAILVAKHGVELLNNAYFSLIDSEYSREEYKDAAIKAIAYLAFINPTSFPPLIKQLISEKLSVDSIRKITKQEIEIWKANDGTLVIDVIATKQAKSLENKNSKDYETLKWEDSIRKNQHKNASRKLSKEEELLVKEQLSTESEIRKTVNRSVSSIKYTLKIIAQLSEDAKILENGLKIWFPVAVNQLLDILQLDAFFTLFNNLGESLFLQLSFLLSEKTGMFAKTVGMATMKLYNVPNLTSDTNQSATLDIVSTALFKIKHACRQKPLESMGLTYILPLLTKVMEEGKKVAIKNANKPVTRGEFVEEEPEEELLLLALDIVCIHAQVFQDTTIPRSKIIAVLLSLLTLPSKAKLAKEYFITLCQNISASPTEDDLKLLLSGLLTPNQFAQASILEALDEEYDLQPIMKYSPEVFITSFNEDSTISELASFVWESNQFEISTKLMKDLFNFFEQSGSGSRLFTARAFAAAASYLSISSNEAFKECFSLLMNFYVEKAKPPQDILDEFGLVAVSASQQKDSWEARSTVALCFKELAPSFKETGAVVVFVKFLLEYGALGDKDVLVRDEMKEAGVEVISLHGSKHVEELIPLFEDYISTSKDIIVKENVIVLYGALGRHLHTGDPRINTIVERLLCTLQTPSEDLQKSIAKCISPLVPLFKQKVGEYVQASFQILFDSTAPIQVRRGAAWGIAGLVKGYGISALSEFDIIRNLLEASENKKDPKLRESAALAFECLSITLGKYFEPYVIEILPDILKSLGDAISEVRDATAEATKAIMSSTTSYGVKKLIPLAASNLEDISWRSKRGSVELLGNMAYLDPTQLSSSLSTIVPEIVGVLNDTHKEVRKAADQSLKRFGEVIRNPEIQKLVPILIQAIGDPTKHTEEALDALIKTQFVHYIDGPSLALIIHVIHRGMRDRSANTKRKACKIVGNMAILVDSKDLIPYLQQLIDEVEIAMVDPVPNTRATAARALGALVERLGESQFPDLIPRLLATLSDNAKSGDRLGSAQALAEVISGLGIAKLEELLPTILSGVTHYRAYVREGFMPLMLFLPVCFGQQFAPYINQVIQPILSGLADTDDNIRETSLKAGKLIVKNYATKAIDLLLPELENGMFDENERIRLSSVQLTGDLLFQVTGISSKNEFSEDDAEYNVEVSRQITDVLGEERRSRVLSSLFVCRSDVSGIVRATTVDIWKALVPNTPRTIKEVLPTLTTIIVVHLASSSRTLRLIAAQALGDLVRRVGGNALSQLLPTLKESLDTATDSNSKQGVCIALRELIESTSAESLYDFQDVVVCIINSTLIDEDETVRESAALCFDSFQERVGKAAIDGIIPHLLNVLEEGEKSEYALLALQEIMATKSEVIFPILVPTLLAEPIDSFKATAIGSLAEVAGPALYKRTSTIVNSVIDALISTEDIETKTALESSLDKIFVSVSDAEGLHPLMQQIMSLLKHDDIQKKATVLERLPNFFEHTSLDYSIYTADIVTNAILCLDDSNSRIVEGNFNMLTALVKNQEKYMLEKLVKPAKQALEMVGVPGAELEAFKLSKGPNCILPIFLHGLMYGSGDEREASALAIADVVSKTPATGLKAYVTVITGPLIRVMGERFNSDIKAAILYALNVLFSKIPQLLRPFIPQLQRTFVKSLSDPSNETLRLRAAKALGTLIEYQPRVDPLVAELVTNAKQSTDDGVKTAMLRALLEAVSKAGIKLNQNSKTIIVNLVEEEIYSANEKLAVTYARLIGSLAGILTTDEATKILQDKVLATSLDGDSGKFGILTLNSFLKEAPNHLFETRLMNEVVQYIVAAVNSPNPYFSDNGILAIGKILLMEAEFNSPYSKTKSETPFHLGDENIKVLVQQLAVTMLRPVSNSADSRRLSLVIVRTLARFKYEECVAPYYDQLGPSVFSCLREMIIPIKLAAEKAYLAMFRMVEEEAMDTFMNWFDNLPGSTINNSVDEVLQLRSIGDYTKRVGKRLAKVEREKIAAGGDAETMFSDRFEDENEIWSVGGIDTNPDA